MNTSILVKVLNALNENEPNISYIKGMLETVIEMSGSNPIVEVPKSTFTRSVNGVATKVDEEVDEILLKYNGGKTGSLN